MTIADYKYQRDIDKVLTFVRIQVTRNANEKERDVLNEHVLNIAKLAIEGVGYMHYKK